MSDGDRGCREERRGTYRAPLRSCTHTAVVCSAHVAFPSTMAVSRDAGARSIHQDGEELAPVLEVPDRAVFSVEHPCIIKNVDKGIKSLGGAVRLARVSASCSPVICSLVDLDRP